MDTGNFRTALQGQKWPVEMRSAHDIMCLERGVNVIKQPYFKTAHTGPREGTQGMCSTVPEFFALKAFLSCK